VCAYLSLVVCSLGTVLGVESLYFYLPQLCPRIVPTA
jgi:hypothetical protein